MMPNKVVENCLGALGSSYLANAFPVIFNAEEASYVIIEKAYRKQVMLLNFDCDKISIFLKM